MEVKNLGLHVSLLPLRCVSTCEEQEGQGGEAAVGRAVYQTVRTEIPLLKSSWPPSAALNVRFSKHLWGKKRELD